MATHTKSAQVRHAAAPHVELILRPRPATCAWLLTGVAVALAWLAGVWGPIVAAILLCAGLHGAALIEKSSERAFLLAAGPIAGGLTGLAILGGLRAGVAGGLGIALAGALACVTAWQGWKHGVEGFERRRRARMEAERRRHEAESAAAAAAGFAAAAGRELHAPLQAILSAAEMIERSPNAEALIVGQAAQISAAARKALAAVGDLSDGARLDAGRMVLEHSSFDPRALVSEIVASMAGPAARSGVDIRFEAAEALPRLARGDRARLRQVIESLGANLLAAFGGPGVLVIRAHAMRLAGYERRGDDPAEWLVRLELACTGACLRGGEVARLAAQLDPTQPPGGVGLGVSRGIARLMGGDLFAEARGEAGATFTLEIALGGAAEAQADGVKTLRVLVADPQVAARRAISLLLEPHGVQVVLAGDPTTSLALLSAQVFDVALLDIESGGLEACRRLRSLSGPNQRTPVIGCATSFTDELRDACRRAGVTELVSKPVEQLALYASLQAALRSGGPQVEAAA